MEGDMDFKAKTTACLKNISRKFGEFCTEAVETMEVLGNQFETAQTTLENVCFDFVEQVIPLISSCPNYENDLFTPQTNNTQPHENFPSEVLTINDESLVNKPLDQINNTAEEKNLSAETPESTESLSDVSNDSSVDGNSDGESVRSDDFFSVVSDYGISESDGELEEEVSSNGGLEVEVEEEEVCSDRELEVEVEEEEEEDCSDGEEEEEEEVCSDGKEEEEVCSDGELEVEEEVCSDGELEVEEEEVCSDGEEEEDSSDGGETEVEGTEDYSSEEPEDDSSCVTKQDMKVMESFGKDLDELCLVVDGEANISPNQETMKVSGNQIQKVQNLEILERLEVLVLCEQVHSGISRSQVPSISWSSESFLKASNGNSDDSSEGEEPEDYSVYEPDMEAFIQGFEKEITEYLFEGETDFFEGETETDLEENSILNTLEDSISYAEELHSKISRLRFPHGYCSSFCSSESLSEASHDSSVDASFDGESVKSRDFSSNANYGKSDDSSEGEDEDDCIIESYNEDLIREALEAEDLIIHELSEAKIPAYQGALGNQSQMQTSLYNLCSGDVEQVVPLIYSNPNKDVTSIIQQTKYSDYLTSHEKSPSEAEMPTNDVDELFDYTPLEQSDDTDLEPQATTGELLERTPSPPQTPKSNEDDDQFASQISTRKRLEDFISSYAAGRSDDSGEGEVEDDDCVTEPDIEDLMLAYEKEVDECTVVMHEDNKVVPDFVSVAKIAPCQENELETFEVVNAEEVKLQDEHDLSDSDWEII